MNHQAPAGPHRFSVRDRAFEIRVAQIGNGIQVRCFEGERDTGINGSVSLETSSDFAAYGLGSATFVLVDAVERYVRDAIEHGM